MIKDSQYWWDLGAKIGFFSPLLYGCANSIYAFFTGDLGTAILYPIASLIMGLMFMVPVSCAVGLSASGIEWVRGQFKNKGEQ